MTKWSEIQVILTCNKLIVWSVFFRKFDENVHTINLLASVYCRKKCRYSLNKKFIKWEYSVVYYLNIHFKKKKQKLNNANKKNVPFMLTLKTRFLVLMSNKFCETHWHWSKYLLYNRFNKWIVTVLFIDKIWH